MSRETVALADAPEFVAVLEHVGQRLAPGRPLHLVQVNTRYADTGETFTFTLDPRNFTFDDLGETDAGALCRICNEPRGRRYLFSIRTLNAGTIGPLGSRCIFLHVLGEANNTLYGGKLLKAGQDAAFRQRHERLLQACGGTFEAYFQRLDLAWYFDRDLHRLARLPEHITREVGRRRQVGIPLDRKTFEALRSAAPKIEGDAPQHRVARPVPLPEPQRQALLEDWVRVKSRLPARDHNAAWAATHTPGTPCSAELTARLLSMVKVSKCPVVKPIRPPSPVMKNGPALPPKTLRYVRHNLREILKLFPEEEHAEVTRQVTTETFTVQMVDDLKSSVAHLQRDVGELQSQFPGPVLVEEEPVPFSSWEHFLLKRYVRAIMEELPESRVRQQASLAIRQGQATLSVRATLLGILKEHRPDLLFGEKCFTKPQLRALRAQWSVTSQLFDSPERERLSELVELGYFNERDREVVWQAHLHALQVAPVAEQAVEAHQEFTPEDLFYSRLARALDARNRGEAARVARDSSLRAQCNLLLRVHLANFLASPGPLSGVVVQVAATRLPTLRPEPQSGHSGGHQQHPGGVDG